MDLTFTVNLLEVLAAITSASELISLSIANHSRRVSYIGLRIAESLQLNSETCHRIVQAGYLHDIGISSSREKLDLADLSKEYAVYKPHCYRGATLLQRSEVFKDYSEIVLTHHDSWKASSKPSLISRIIHVADRVEMLINKNRYILEQQQDIINHLKDQPDEFDPKIVTALIEVASKPSFWLDLQFENYLLYLKNYVNTHVQTLTLEQLESIADIYGSIVDDKSPFTLTHSHGVAKHAVALAAVVGFNQYDQKLIRIAGLLHDLGKLAVPDSILDYPGKLTQQQMLIVKQHTYHTYHLLNSLGPEARQIQNWAAFHHEKLDGSGYPFGLKEDQLDLGSRILAIADITQALAEKRPYRKQLPISTISRILLTNGRENKIDLDLANLMIEILSHSNLD